MTKKTKTTIGLLAFVLALVVVVAPNFIRARSTRATNPCLNNLRRIDAAKQQWALENNKSTDDTPTWDAVLPYIGSGTNSGVMPVCPEGGTYILGRVGEDPRCTFHRDYRLR
jgi:hypothetical protein